MKAKVWFLWCVALILYLVLAQGSCRAETISWTNPTTYTDGTPIGMAAITTHLYVGDAAAGPFSEFATATGTSWTGTLSQPAGSTKYYTAKAFVAGVSSDYCTPVAYNISLPTPNPGTNLRITK